MTTTATALRDFPDRMLNPFTLHGDAHWWRWSLRADVTGESRPQWLVAQLSVLEIAVLFGGITHHLFRPRSSARG